MNATVAERQPSLSQVVFGAGTALRELRPHQVTALERLKESLRSGCRRPLLELPTGAGKTVVAAHIVAGALAKGNRVAFVVPLLNLIDQTFERFMENGIDPADMGVIQGDHQWRRARAPIQICSIQTVAKRGFPDASVVVVDEAHIRFAALDRWMANSDAVFIGLSATPWSKGLGLQFDDLIAPITMRELIEQGYLSPFRVFCPSHPDLSGIRTVAGDYHEGDLSERMSQPQLVADVVGNWLEKAERQPTLLFGVDRAHAERLHVEFTQSGVRSAYVDAYTPRDERLSIGRQFGAGAIEIICSVGTMTTGVDLDVRCIVFARPTKSEMMFVQCIGRGLRTAEGKAACTIFDHSDTHLRLGMVTDIGRDRLDTRKPGEKSDSDRPERTEPLPTSCSACSSLIPARAKACGNCGHVPVRRSDVESVDGELVELGVAAKSKPKSATDRISSQGKKSIYAQLVAIQWARGRKDGWRDRTFKDIFGVWPRGLLAEPSQPSSELLAFIRHRDIAFAKSRKAALQEDSAHV